MPGRTIAAGQRFPGDDGSADPRAAAALAAYAAGQGSEHAALTALASTRLLVPVVAVLTEAGGGGPAGGGEPAVAGGKRLRREKTSEMAMPTLVGNDGRHAVPAFTCLASLTRWRPDARPVPVPAAQVWQAGMRDASAVVLDVAGPVPLAVEGARLAALAAGQPVPHLHEDPDLLAAAAAAAAAEPLLAGAALAAGGEDSDLALQVTVAAGAAAAAPAVQAAIQRAAGHLVTAAGGRLRRGLEVSVTVAGAP